MIKRANRKPKRIKKRVLSFLVILTLLSFLFGSKGIAIENDVTIENVINNNNAEIVEDTVAVNNEAQYNMLEFGKFPTDDNFETIGGQYSIKYILKNYNVFSFKDITGSHIVGPIIAKDSVKKMNNNVINDAISVVDYSKGKPSYIGKIESLPGSSAMVNTAVKLDYGYDSTKTIGFTAPSLYTQWSSVDIAFKGGQYWMSNEEGKYFINPNNTGKSPILQNDEFINFKKAEEAIIAESKKIASIPSIEVSPDKDTGYLRIEAGNNYIIKDASRLRIVDIRFPSGYLPPNKSYPYPTFINVVDDTLVKSGEYFSEVPIQREDNSIHTIESKTYSNIKGEEHQYFPIILINGKAYVGGKSISGSAGEGLEFGDDINIVWNLPNIKTDGGYKVVLQDYGNHIGHIIAPQAEIYNYKEHEGNFSWNGGNADGGIIAKAWYGGNLEIHFWPYASLDFDNPIFKGFNIKGKKNYEGDTLKGNDFNFKLEWYDSSEIHDGVVADVLPQIVSNDIDGIFNFTPIIFNKEGIYEFLIKEVIPDNLDTKITYDMSEYKLTVVVKKNLETSNLDIKSECKKIKDENGNLIDNPIIVDEVTFKNEMDYSLPSTGGNGKGSYFIIGVLMMLLSSAIYFIKNR